MAGQQVHGRQVLQSQKRIPITFGDKQANTLVSWRDERQECTRLRSGGAKLCSAQKAATFMSAFRGYDACIGVDYTEKDRATLSAD